MNLLEGEFGIAIIRFFQTGIFGELCWYFLLPFHYLGSEMGFLVILPVIYWSVHKKLGKELLILVLLSTVLALLLKVWWARPRPFHIAPEDIIPIEFTAEYGLPSGHTIFGTILGLSLSKVSKTNMQVFLSFLLILLMGISRMVHGMHFLQDVLLGLALGILFFFIFHKLNPVITRLYDRMRLPKQLILTSLSSGIVFLPVFLLIDDHAFGKSLLAPLGAVFGGILGIITESGLFRLSDAKNMKINIVRSLTGLPTTVIIYLLLDKGYYALVGNIESSGVLFLYLIRYSLVGFWITGGVPFLFNKLKLN